jgi:hypothetical protein
MEETDELQGLIAIQFGLDGKGAANVATGWSGGLQEPSSVKCQ